LDWVQLQVSISLIDHGWRVLRRARMWSFREPAPACPPRRRLVRSRQLAEWRCTLGCDRRPPQPGRLWSCCAEASLNRFVPQDASTRPN